MFKKRAPSMDGPNPWEEAYSNMAKADEARKTSMGSMGPGEHVPLTDPKDLETPCSLCGQNREPTFRSPRHGWICCHRGVCEERQGRSKIDEIPGPSTPLCDECKHWSGGHAYGCSKIDGNAPYEKVDHPKHYNEHPAGIECIDVIEEMSFNLGNAVKYIWRAGLKPDSKNDEDLAKAEWYLKRERERLAKRPKK